MGGRAIRLSSCPGKEGSIAAAPVRRVFTVGHSNQPLERLLDLLRQHAIEVLVDVRSRPYSGYAPHFSADPLKSALLEAGMRYLFLGRELGGRPEDPAFYDPDGRVRYDRVAEALFFREGIRRLEQGIGQFRVAILCGEEDPSGCHRRLLIGRVLRERGVQVLHLRGDGRVQTEEDLADAEVPRAGEAKQPLLFHAEEVTPWTSIRSVSPRRRPPSSSGSSDEPG